MTKQSITLAALSALALVTWCAGTAHAQVSIDWAGSPGGISIAVDSQDNVYTLSYSYALGAEMVLNKRDSTGQQIWVASYDQTDFTKWERASWVSVDHEDNIIVTGTLMSGYSNPVEAASIVMKFSPLGVLLWRNVYESSFDGSSTRRCLVDADNNVYVLGIGSGPPGFVTKVKKFAADGSVVWTYYNAAGIGAPVMFKLTPDNAIVITGRAIYGSLNGYAKIDLDGNEIWSLAGVQSLTVGDAAGDSLGNTYVVHGEYVPGGGGTVVKKLDPTGALVWQNTFPLTAYRVQVGPDDLPIACGFPNSGSGGAAFIKVDTAGGLVWSNLDADGPLGLLLHAQLEVDGIGNAYLAAGTLFEMAICKVRSDGSSGWTALVSGGGYAAACALSRLDNSVYVVGNIAARLVQPPDAGQQFRRGDANVDASFNIADAIFMLNFLFGGPVSPLSCDDANDANDDGALNIADAIAILNALFGGGGGLPAPYASCGVDLTQDTLDCLSFAPCP
ncbi:MAG: hypothetical protein ACKVX7_16695 [Planctomycetota bacterium]